MRISTAQQFEGNRHDLSVAHARMSALQKQVVTGRRLNTLREDPMGSVVVMDLRNVRKGVEQHLSNVKTAKSRLAFAENALAETDLVLKRAYNIAVYGANDPTGPDGRLALALEVEELQRRLLDLANTRGPSGESLFAGRATDQQAFVLVGNAIVYNGDTGVLQVEAGPTETLQTNVVGDPSFRVAYDRLETLRQYLLNNETQNISVNSLADLQSSLDEMLAHRGTVGSRMRTAEEYESYNTRRIDELGTRISEVEDVDLMQAISDYRLAEAAYQAALTMAGQSFRLSLMDFIRG
jgi:flagellar hook-associated protein 3 FlgL